MSKRIDNLSSLNWDDTALINAYNKGMSLRGKDCEKNGNTAKENFMKHSKNKSEWKVGEHCRAIYYGDEMWYEAKITSIDGDMCTVLFLGYDEEVEVELDSLDISLGKKAIKKQKKNAKKDLILSDIDGTASEGDTRNDHNATQDSHHHRRHHHHHSRRGCRRNNETRMLDQSNNCTAAESTFYSAYPVARCPEMPTAVLPPPPPLPVPMPSCSEVTQDPSLSPMLAAWYMAGYYTGLHEAHKTASQQRCYCHQ